MHAVVVFDVARDVGILSNIVRLEQGKNGNARLAHMFMRANQAAKCMRGLRATCTSRYIAKILHFFTSPPGGQACSDFPVRKIGIFICGRRSAAPARLRDPAAGKRGETRMGTVQPGGAPGCEQIDGSPHSVNHENTFLIYGGLLAQLPAPPRGGEIPVNSRVAVSLREK